MLLFPASCLTFWLIFLVVRLRRHHHAQPENTNSSSTEFPPGISDKNIVAASPHDKIPPISPQEPETEGIPCRYDGHCPIGSTCGVAKNNPFNSTQEHYPGTCQVIPIVSRSLSSEACYKACRVELEMDEHFFHELTVPVIQKQYATHASSRPRGCVLDFVRQPLQEKLHQQPQSLQDLYAHDGPQFPPYEPQPSIVTWEKTRFRHIVRVDPILSAEAYEHGKPNSNEPVVWRAYCTAPCQVDADCQPTTQSHANAHSKTGDILPFICVEGACQRNAPFWEGDLDEAGHPSMILVTAATPSYYKGLTNLLASIRYWAPHHKVVVYSLGLNADMIHDLQTVYSKNVMAVEWTSSPSTLDNYPPHVRIGKKYAWKALAIQESLKRYQMIFWLDAGSVLTGPINPVENIAKRQGLFLAKGQDTDMKPQSNTDTFVWFGWDKAQFPAGPSYGGGTRAYLYPSRYIDSIVNKDASCSLDEQCIAPNGTSTNNHRFDQTTLSICAYHPFVQAPHHTEYVANDAAHVLPQRLQPSYRFVWTARQHCHDYQRVRGNYLANGLKPLDWTKLANRTGPQPANHRVHLLDQRKRQFPPRRQQSTAKMKHQENQPRGKRYAK